MGGAGSPTFKLLSAERQKEIANRVRDIALIKSLRTIQIYLTGSFLVNNLLTSHRCGYVWAKRGSVVTKQPAPLIITRQLSQPPVKYRLLNFKRFFYRSIFYYYATYGKSKKVNIVLLSHWP